MKPYNEFVGRLIDRGLANSRIARHILKAEEAGQVKVPIKVWAMCDRVRLLETQEPKIWKAGIGPEFENRDPTTFFDQPKWVRRLRLVLKSPDWSAGLKRRTEWQAELIRRFPFIDDWFGGGKRQSLKDLGLVDDNGKWSEQRFQKTVRLLDAVRRKKLPLHPEKFRLWATGLADMDGTLRKRVLPFDWLLCDDRLSPDDRYRAHRIADLIMSADGRGGWRDIPHSGDIITAAHTRKINKTLLWFCDPIERPKWQYLYGLAITARLARQRFDGERFAKGVQFAVRHINEPPDCELMKDFLDGYVRLNGKGIYQ